MPELQLIGVILVLLIYFIFRKMEGSYNSLMVVKEAGQMPLSHKQGKAALLSVACGMRH